MQRRDRIKSDRYTNIRSTQKINYIRVTLSTVSVCPVERCFFGSQIFSRLGFFVYFLYLSLISQGGNSIEGETVTWDE
jgi:hypothetical protein